MSLKQQLLKEGWHEVRCPPLIMVKGEHWLLHTNAIGPGSRIDELMPELRSGPKGFVLVQEDSRRLYQLAFATKAQMLLTVMKLRGML